MVRPSYIDYTLLQGKELFFLKISVRKLAPKSTTRSPVDQSLRYIHIPMPPKFIPIDKSPAVKTDSPPQKYHPSFQGLFESAYKMPFHLSSLILLTLSTLTMVALANPLPVGTTDITPKDAMFETAVVTKRGYCLNHSCYTYCVCI